ncbi:MAG: protein translocase subunit SecF [Gammaproteobacteria bacterium]|nr:protein translocase subunit SecF [Gammaproteobacteria bacterium]
MILFKKQTTFDFIGRRRIAIAVSMILIAITMVSLFVRGLNLGLDFTGGTLVELSYAESIEISDVRTQLAAANFADAVVQHFGTARDVMVRIPLQEGKDSAVLSNTVVQVLHNARDEVVVESRPGQRQQCTTGGSKTIVDCNLQVRRVEFVGPQIGDELVEKGGLALLYTLIAILIYVLIRFEWRFAVGSTVAVAHDVLLTFGFFSFTQIEFSLPVLAAILAVLGYSLNDTIVVFDRIRENFRRMRKAKVPDIMNASINQTLARTIITSGTTMLTVLALFFLGGEIIHGFSTALIAGIIVGTYSSIYIATPTVLALGISRQDMLPVKKEGAEPSRPSGQNPPII